MTMDRNMRADGKLAAGPLRQMAETAREHESRGYAGLWTSESQHDPFLPLVAAAQATRRLELGTAIAVAFARSPMTLAYTAWDLQRYTEGRFTLGLGSQVKAHIERRFSMPWSRPAARMREMVSAVRAIWDSWQDGSKLSFEGDFYRHTLMTPFFSPGPLRTPAPKIVIAAVGEAMCRVAGEVCDGILLHGFTTERYIREVTLPTVREGQEKAGRSDLPFEVVGLPLTATGTTEESLAAAVSAVRQQIAFYASTPAYRGVLELHGWGELGDELHALSRGDDPEKWTKMGDAVDDEVLNTFAVVGAPDEIALVLSERFGDLVTRFQFYAPYEHDLDVWTPALEHFAQASA
ncbi:TIGR03617 family F420-dependent LLM class oxidoreductase [Actinomadura sp. LD22]|uniref:TIGR03617 family F420-dependent LLM class oxidoreductase n=1 Tax=Actinomadura physcomitrii TaxID=2650748 RepID=A0A6I4MFB0_9ACTN|nr:TIGR03617 family F420-dependent LLM class oxidoreductase [Actinomadura physcomitrii]MWA04898.1 TIGR03617 family F420-dependent LLM class oxidoreductase [Actinomadura physcomitrii]